MSRSFGKTGKGYPMRRGWHKCMRARERFMIHREMMSADYGDVIFPIVSEVSSPWHDDSYSYYLFKKEIRDKYFLEIRNILNGYIDRKWHREEESDEIFMEEYLRIKGLVPDDGRKFSFEWLNEKAVRNVIKTWPGEPFEVLGYLTRHGFIERAVSREFKITTSK
jgi:hypothetical protein